ncbi:hypothetical protein V497_04061 [Pseudogymnoascus sp. VKM F-4516 (FW-969)]|nr:hypothetical protein V497_04061 [Pseudogymnoascus sp. VKM F-4516 (FW-969)]
MVARLPLAQAALAVLLTCAHPSAAQTTSIIDMFIFDSAPLSLEASIVAVSPDPSYTYHKIATYAIDCPKSSSPANDACRAQSIYPAEVWHTDGPWWGGRTTARLDDSTTVWECNLATGGLGAAIAGPSCIKNITDAAGATRVETTSINDCYIFAHSVPLVITAGAEKMPYYYYSYGKGGVSSLHSDHSSVLTSLNCAATSRTAWTNAPATTTSGGGAGATGATTGPTATTSQASDTATGSSSPSPTATGGSSGAITEISWLVAMGAAVMCLVIQ